ncbi:adenosylmethionine--8-amino-7-oxononanoate transaminase [Paludibacterium purpuratum]|uniref:Adenosylmethionine-8-amino-7-oxononanoate aminotransferase n=1 Tax=Paludibacterium purpuratum TaxID=1144873 RepID=A0A4R7B777_9NEIS|nr:adenosylmethionine--8-amino-7-oxononanoate transaminase [Paludibacterium purpuratum]TDR80323.1 adenosylmethionine-8-amino-7-oxononanoate aminotransferase [Paludibacterium purpuratum]
MSNQDWLSRSTQAVWHPCTQMKRHERFPLVPIASAQGAWLTDFDGKRYLDAVSSWWVNLLGHGHPRIKQAIRDQLDTLEHVMLAGFTHRPVIELSERLTALTGLGHAFYGSDGASATEIALKMSFHYWKNNGQAEKCRFISLENSYHGETVGALAVTDVPLFSATYAPLLQKALRVPTPDARLAAPGESASDVARRAAQALENVLAKRAGEVAALILEPLVQGAAGMAMYHPDYLREARRLCDRYRVHLIADEIAVGFGRTGTLFACEQAGIRPDFLCLSKGITGGFLPLSCVLTSDEVYRAFYSDDVRDGFLHSHSYTGNPLACSAALAVLDTLQEEDILAQNRDKAARFSHLLAPLAARDDVRHFRQQGMIWAFDVESPRGDFAQAFFAAMLERGCLVRPIGTSVYFMPPYCLQDDEMQQLADATQQTLDQLSRSESGATSQPALP